MQFILNDMQQMMQDTARRLMSDRYSFEQRRQIVQSPHGYSPELWSEYASLGLLGIEIDEAFGGSGGSFQDLAVVLEAFGRGLAVEPFIPTIVLGAGLVSAAGAQAQKQAILPAIAEGRMKLALAYGEPEGRYDPAHVTTIASKDGEGFVLTGRKAVVFGAGDADILVVSARTSGSITGRAGISLFLVERDAKGIDAHPYPNIDDRQAAEITLDGVHVPADALLGPLDGGFPLLDAALDRGAAALCWEAVGAMAALNALTVEYLKTRQQFGRPIGQFQALQHRMADMVIAEELGRSMAFLAAGQAANPDAGVRNQAISAAKVQIGQSSQVVGRGAIQLHGGIGLTMEYSAAHYFRRLTAIEMMFGDTGYHLARFAV